MPLEPRRLRQVGPTLGSYLRPGRNNHTAVGQLLAESRLATTGIVFDPCLASHQRDIAVEARRQGIEVVLDPRSVELSTVGGFSQSGVDHLPWAGDRPHRPPDLRGASATQAAETIAEYVVEHEMSAVLAPAHLVERPSDPWAAADRELAQALRLALDAAGRRDLPIYFPLVIQSQSVRTAETRHHFATYVQFLPVDALWLRMHPFGTTNSGPLALRRYIDLCRDLQRAGIPLVAERTGTVGVALLAFGAVGGIESGITFGEQYNVAPLLRPLSGSRFSPAPRVYFSELGEYRTRKEAEAFFQRRGMKSAFGCKDAGCCPRGVADTLRDPRRHFLIRRGAEIADLSQTPVDLRRGVYMERFLRPASDMAVRAARAEPAFEKTRRRLDSWRQTLGSLQQIERQVTEPLIPEGQRIRRRRGA
jgi:hypothetical protein